MIYELKNIAVLPDCQRKGYGKSLIEFLFSHYTHCRTMLVGTGDVPSALTFYNKCGFTESHRIKNFFIPKIKTADLIVFASPLLFWTLSSKIKAFIERFYCIAEEDRNPPLGRYERYPVKDAALLMTSADNYFWTYEQAISYYKFAIINYIGFQDKGMLLAGGCGDTNGKPQIDKTNHLRDAYNFGKNIYRE